MKVYVVTSGYYEDYTIENVFFNKEKARFYQMINCPYNGSVEEYEVNDEVISDDQRNRLIEVTYDIKDGAIRQVTVCSTNEETNQIKFEWCQPFYVFTLRLGKGRLFSNVIRYGRNSKMLLKIAQDRLAQHLHERETTREEIIERAEQMYYDKYGHLPYTHIVRTAMPEVHEVDVPSDPVWDEVAKRLRERVKNGETLPSSLDDLYKQVAEDLGVKVTVTRLTISPGGNKHDTESDS